MWTAVYIFLLLLNEQMFANGYCSIALSNDNYNFQALLKGFQWVTPIDNLNGNKPYLYEKESVEFYCENGFVDDSFTGKTYKFTCINGKLNETFVYEDLLCRSNYHKKTKTSQISNTQLGSDIFKCDGRYLEVYQVGTEQSDGTIKNLYKICFDRNFMTPKFVYQPSRNERMPIYGEARTDVWGFDRFGSTALERLKLSEGYVSGTQKGRITSAFSDRYNKRNKYPHAFGRGHLVPYSDFLNAEEKQATCMYINAAPQWKELNKNSWSTIEYEVRSLVNSDPIQWEIYTGIYGSIPTTRGLLYLSPFYDFNGKFLKAYLPVPKLFWKYLRNKLNENLSRVFVGINNPEISSTMEITNDYLICKPKSQNGRLIRGNHMIGYIYECNVREFLEKLAKEEKIVKM